MNRFTWLFGSALAAVFISLALLAHNYAPPNTRWLGVTIFNTSDTAVYFSYLRQGADGKILLSDLYSVEPNQRRFDPIWSSLGLIARTGVNPILIHEAARVFAIFFLVWSVYAAAYSIPSLKEHAKLTTFLAFGGISTGWIYTVYLGIMNLWTPKIFDPADLGSEFAIAPVLFGGVHIILSIALLITSVRYIWDGLVEISRRKIIYGGLAGFVLLSFHPYFSLLLALLAVIAVFSELKDDLHLWQRIKLTLGLGLMLLPPIIYYLWLITDPVFGTHHLYNNILPLGGIHLWIITLSPFLIAFVWMIKNKQWTTKLNWQQAWVISVLILLVLLPVPWKRKLTEGLLIPIVLLTMPFWIKIRYLLEQQQPKLIRLLLTGLVITAAWFGPLHLLASQLMWLDRSGSLFFQPESIFKAANILAKTETNTIILSDDHWTNVWLPSLTGKTVWMGHDHETPGFTVKRKKYYSFLAEIDPIAAKQFLIENQVDYFITTSNDSRVKFEMLLSPDWKNIFQDDETAIFTSASTRQ